MATLRPGDDRPLDAGGVASRARAHRGRGGRGIRRQAAAPALDPLDAAAPSETEGHVDDTKVVNPQPAEKPTDNPPQLRAIDAQRLSSRCNR